MEMDVVVYTANIGSYDRLVACRADESARWLYFTDGDEVPYGWEPVKVERVMQHPKADSLRVKCLPHLWMPEADLWIWHDARIALRIDPACLLPFAESTGMAVAPHPLYRCLYDEMHITGRTGYRQTDRNRLAEQRSSLKRHAYPEQAGLADTGLLVRQNTDAVCTFNEAWWADICRWATWRDQFSFAPVSRMTIGYQSLPIPDLRDHEWLEYQEHVQ